jgi:hypothetical protein
MTKRMKVVVKVEELAGRVGVSIYINGGLSRHVVEALSLFEELRMLQALGEFDVTFK